MNTASFRQRAASGSVWTASSTIGLVVLQLFQLFVLSRLLTKEAFGLYAVVQIIVQIALQFSDLGIGAAVVQRINATSAELSSLYWLNVVFGACIAACIAGSSPLVVWFFQNDRLSPLLWMAAFALLATSFGQQYQYILQRELRFKALALIEIAAALIGTGAAILSAYCERGAISFLDGLLAASVARAFLLILSGCRHHKPAIRLSYSEVRSYLRFGVLLSGQNAVNLISTRIDSLIIGKLLGPEALGVYYFSQQFTAQLYQKVAAVVGRVGFPLLAKAQTSEPLLREMFLDFTRTSCTFVYPMLSLVYVLAEHVVVAFFPERWWMAIGVIRLLIVVMFLRAALTSIGVLLIAKGRNDLGLCGNLLILILSTVAMLIGAHIAGLAGVICGLVIANIGGAILWLLVLAKYFRISAKLMFNALVLPSMMALAVLASGTTILWLSERLYLESFVALFATAISAVLTCALVNRSWRAYLRRHVCIVFGMQRT